MEDSAIEITQISKSYGNKKVLHEVSLQIPMGQTMALLGRNGAGKSTTIKILLGMLRADTGKVRIKGLDPSKNSNTVLSQIGYLAEDQTMYPWMTPVELCKFLAPFYPTWDAPLADDYLDRFEIPSSVRIGRLSKGESVKLGLAVALAHRPSVVILDDPAMGLDPISRKEFNRQLVEHLQAEGITILYSSHLLDEVEAIADTVAILDQGRIIRSGSTESIREDVKKFLIPANCSAAKSLPQSLLDVRFFDDRIAITTGRALEFQELLTDLSIEYEVVDLSLDEIFESFVIGRKTYSNPAAISNAL